MWNFEFGFEFIPFLVTVLNWGIILTIAHFIYIKQNIKPKRWKVFVVIFVGIFAFHFSWQSSGTVLRFPILPLGVWILYGILKKKEGRWRTYRRFAWLGFWANVLFLATSLLSAQVQPLVYPPDEVSTYIADVQQAEALHVHPSADDLSVEHDLLTEQNWQEAPVQSVAWYEAHRDERERVDEQFPYLLKGYEPKWGSGAESRIYVEKDGKGLLISTAEQQYYFQAEQSVFQGEVE
ncbi:hypothetical protein LCM20_17565 [Halobacillus litoralis]|uniref:hypothetical protein n=1 Tax=Halobacillus litoralis TaxID=45668 RepID=UPI001CD5B5B5|nr:hypothetical protein [Halobacillus litoralis]MCA0972406.1 hypothetical protein [Halobacillus litoralis]